MRKYNDFMRKPLEHHRTTEGYWTQQQPHQQHWPPPLQSRMGQEHAYYDQGWVVLRLIQPDAATIMESRVPSAVATQASLKRRHIYRALVTP